MHLWDRLIRQVQATLKMSRPSIIYPQLLAFTTLKRNHNFDAITMAPLGTQIVVHGKPNKSKILSPPGIDGWYMGPTWNHYRCHEVYIPRLFDSAILSNSFQSMWLWLRKQRNNKSSIISKNSSTSIGNNQKNNNTVEPLFKELKESIKIPIVNVKCKDLSSSDKTKDNSSAKTKPVKLISNICVREHKYSMRSKIQNPSGSKYHLQGWKSNMYTSKGDRLSG